MDALLQSKRIHSVLPSTRAIGSKRPRSVVDAIPVEAYDEADAPSLCDESDLFGRDESLLDFEFTNPVVVTRSSVIVCCERHAPRSSNSDLCFAALNASGDGAYSLQIDEYECTYVYGDAQVEIRKDVFLPVVRVECAEAALEKQRVRVSSLLVAGLFIAVAMEKMAQNS